MMGFGHKILHAFNSSNSPLEKLLIFKSIEECNVMLNKSCDIFSEEFYNFEKANGLNSENEKAIQIE